MASWRQHLPDWELKSWNERSLELDSPYYQTAIARKQWAFAADYARLYLLNRYGGLYLDTDMELIRPLEPLCAACPPQGGIIGFETSKMVNLAFVLSQPDQPLLQELMQSLDNRQQRGESWQPIPVTTTEALLQHGLQTGNDCGAVQSVAGFDIYPSQAFYPYNPYGDPGTVRQLMYADITPQTYTIHHWEGSWVTWKKIKDSVKDSLRSFTGLRRK